MNTHALILAAGKGTRFGYPKAWITYQQQSLVQAHINSLKKYLPVSVVLSKGERSEDLYDCCIIENRYGADMMSSVRIGTSTLDKKAQVLIIPVDTQPQSEETIQGILQYTAPVVCTHQGKVGHPILLSVQAIRTLAFDQNLRHLMQSAKHYEGDAHCVRNFNYPQDWEDSFGIPPKRWNRNNKPTKK
jgi:CTP:molybdopterin cytidylyltransferase MocA